MRDTRSAITFGSCGTTNPSPPLAISSLVAWAGPPITGLAHSHASTITLPKLSRDDGTHSTLHALSSESRISWLTGPSHLTLEPRPVNAFELPLTSGPTKTNNVSDRAARSPADSSSAVKPL